MCIKKIQEKIKSIYLLMCLLIVTILMNSFSVNEAKAYDGEWHVVLSIGISDNGDGTATVTATGKIKIVYEDVHWDAYSEGNLYLYVNGDEYYLGSCGYDSSYANQGYVSWAEGSITVDYPMSSSGSGGSARPITNCKFIETSSSTGRIDYYGYPGSYTTSSSGTISAYAYYEETRSENFEDSGSMTTGTRTSTHVDRQTNTDYLSDYTLYQNGSYVDSGYAYYYSSGSYNVDVYDAASTFEVEYESQGGRTGSSSCTVPSAASLYYNLNGGPGYPPSTQTVWRGKTVTLANKPEDRQNCEFLGWSTTKYDVLEYGKTVSNLISPGTAYTLNSNTTLYAVWRTVKVPYTINFTLNGNKPAKNDFAYITGYVNGGTRVTQSREFSYLEIPGYTVSAKIKSSDENVFIMVGDNKSPGYEYTIPTKTINTETTDTINCGTIHTVAYDVNGGTYGKDAAGNDIPGPEDMTKYYGTSIVVSSNTPTRIGYKFTQWQSDTTGTSYNPGTGYAYSQRGGTDTLKAQWKPITYTIHFDRNTPPGAVTEVTGNMADISQTYDVNSKLPKNAFKLDGCDFQGWNTKPDGSGDSYKDEEVIKNLTAKDGEMVILYAQWKVTYKVVGSLNNVVSENFTDANGTTISVSETFGKLRASI